MGASASSAQRRESGTNERVMQLQGLQDASQVFGDALAGEGERDQEQLEHLLAYAGESEVVGGLAASC